MVLNDARNYQLDGEELGYLYLGTELIWPPKPIDKNTDFLKYYQANIPREFAVSYIVDPNAPSDDFLKNPSFLGPDDGKVIYVDGRDQFLTYKSNNIANEFNSFLPTGVIDQDMDYNQTNIPTEFILYTPVVDGDWDQYMVNPLFAGPDSGRIIYIDGKDQFLTYKSNNIANEFNAFPATGYIDQDMDYDVLNMDTEFLWFGDTVSETAVYDQAILNSFLGPDTGKVIFVDGRARFLTYKSNNISTEFIYFVDTGEIDQVATYDNLNMDTEFLWFGDVVSGTAVYDQGVVTSFLGPDAGENIYINSTSKHIQYKSNNIATEFPGPPITGYFDQDLVYSFSNIEIYFLP